MKVNRKEFLGALELVKGAVAGTSSLAELTHIWFDGEQVQAFNGGLGLCAPLKTEFTGGVPGRLLLGVLQSGSAEEIEITEDGDALEIILNRSRTHLPVLPLDRSPWDYPVKAPKSAGCIALTEELLDALRRVRIVRAKTPSRVEHQGVTLISAKDKALRLYTTDSRMLARIVIEGDFDSENAVLPWAFVEQMVNLCEVGSSLYLTDEFLLATTKEDNAGPRVYSNVLDASDLMDFEDVISNFTQDDAAKAPLPKGLGESLERAALLAATAEKPAITVSVKKNVFFLNGRYSKTTEVDESLDLDGKHPDGKIVVLVDQLQAASGQAETFSIGPEALVFYGDKNFLALMAAFSGK